MARPLHDKGHISETSRDSLWGNFFSTIGAVASVLALMGAIYDAVHEPEIHVHTPQVSDPFVVPFSLHNPSLIFSMYNVRIDCVLKDVKAERRFSFKNDRLRESFAEVIRIPSEKTIQYKCPMNHAIAGIPPILTASIYLDVSFTTLGWNRHTQSELFNWDNLSHQWTEGEIIN